MRDNNVPMPKLPENIEEAFVKKVEELMRNPANETLKKLLEPLSTKKIQ